MLHNKTQRIVRRKGYKIMVAFFNTFLSYLLLMVIILVVAAIGFSIGRVCKKMKDKNQISEASEVENME